jgi:uncharacterized protein (DUF849 family)
LILTEAHQTFAESLLMITSAPNGARRSRRDHPSLPVTPEQLAMEAASLLEQQVSVLHLHVRDTRGGHSLDPEHYKAAITAITAKTGNELVIQVTSESVGMYQREEQMDMVRAVRPEAVSLALRELCPDEAAESGAGRFYEFLQKERIWPQHILYTAGDVERFDQMRRRGVFAEEHPACLLVIGNYAGAQEGTVTELREKFAAADFSCFPWGACCFGANEHEVMLETLALGGHVRIGFENNVLLNDGTKAADNAQLIEQFRKTMGGSHRKPATAMQVREFLAANRG